MTRWPLPIPTVKDERGNFCAVKYVTPVTIALACDTFISAKAGHAVVTYYEAVTCPKCLEWGEGR